MTEKPETGSNPSSQEPATLPPVDPRLLAAMYGLAQEDKIDLLAYWGIIKKRWKLIAYVMMAAAIISAGISLLLPNVYEAKVLMAPVNNQLRRDGGLGVRLGGSGLGNLAALAGITGDTYIGAEQNLAVLQSRAFLWGFVKDNKLMPVLFADDWDASKKSWKESDPKHQPSLWDAYRKFTKTDLLKVSTDRHSGLVTVSVDWTDPVLAADWANRLVARLNDYLRNQAIARTKVDLKYLNDEVQKTSVSDIRQALFALIVQQQKNAMVANTQQQFAFQVLDAATPPDRKIKPHRALIVILSVFITGFLCVVYVLMYEDMRQRRQVEKAESM